MKHKTRSAMVSNSDSKKGRKTLPVHSFAPAGKAIAKLQRKSGHGSNGNGLKGRRDRASQNKAAKGKRQRKMPKIA